MKTLKLYNGFELPALALGTMMPGYFNCPRFCGRDLVSRAIRKLIVKPIEDRSACSSFKKEMRSALNAGFRLIDTSASYYNEKLIVQAASDMGLNATDLFLTGRVSNSAQYKGADGVRAEVEGVLRRFGMDKIDVLMFHWPVTGYYESTWRVLCDFYEKGIAKSIGVANCHRHHLNALMKCGLKPMVNQFEVHPLFTQKSLIGFCQDNDIVVESYSAIARNDPRLMRLPKLMAIGQAHEKTPVQVVIRWHIQQGLIPVVRSANGKRQRENIDVFDFELSREEMSTIDSFNINARIRYDPDNCDFSIL